MSVLFSKGKYYIGDPCYVISNKNWDKLIEETNHFANEEFKFKGKTCFAAGTAFGDGTYYDEEGREYCVDSGLIGVIPFEILDINTEGRGGQIVEFEEDFLASVENGTFRFGNITIVTDDSCDNCDDDDEDWSDDEECWEDEEEEEYEEEEEE